jgi:hypothetical protein
MAVAEITVNAYEVPTGVEKSNVITAAVKFNNSTIEEYCKKYIGTSKSGRRKLLKKIASGVEGVFYTISFSFEKASSGDANISYSLSDGEAIIILSDQSYSTMSEFSADMDYIDNQIESVFG